MQVYDILGSELGEGALEHPKVLLILNQNSVVSECFLRHFTWVSSVNEINQQGRYFIRVVNEFERGIVLGKLSNLENICVFTCRPDVISKYLPQVPVVDIKNPHPESFKKVYLELLNKFYSKIYKAPNRPNKVNKLSSMLKNLCRGILNKQKQHSKVNLQQLVAVFFNDMQKNKILFLENNKVTYNDQEVNTKLNAQTKPFTTSLPYSPSDNYQEVIQTVHKNIINSIRPCSYRFLEDLTQAITKCLSKAIAEVRASGKKLVVKHQDLEFMVREVTKLVLLTKLVFPNEPCDLVNLACNYKKYPKLTLHTGLS